MFRRRGFDAHVEEEKRREKAREAKRGKLFRFFLKDGDEDVPVRFLTEEPILFYEHDFNQGKEHYTCTGEGECEHCADGHRATYRGAWLIVDGRTFEMDEWDAKGNKTGKKKKVKDRIKLFVRGSTDIAKLASQSKKYGLTSRPWFATKTGKDQSTSYVLDRSDAKDPLTKAQIKKLLEQLPEKYRDLYDGKEDSLYSIVEAQLDLLDLEDEEATNQVDDDDTDDDDDDIDGGVMSMDDDDEEEEEKPKKKTLKKPGLKKPTSKVAEKPASKPSPKVPTKRKTPFKKK